MWKIVEKIVLLWKPIFHLSHHFFKIPYLLWQWNCVSFFFHFFLRDALQIRLIARHICYRLTFKVCNSLLSHTHATVGLLIHVHQSRLARHLNAVWADNITVTGVYERSKPSTPPQSVARHPKLDTSASHSSVALLPVLQVRVPFQGTRIIIWANPNLMWCATSQSVQVQREYGRKMRRKMWQRKPEFFFHEKIPPIHTQTHTINTHHSPTSIPRYMIQIISDDSQV